MRTGSPITYSVTAKLSIQTRTSCSIRLLLSTGWHIVIAVCYRSATMVYVLGLLVALQLVLGQSLWKIGTERSGFEFSAAYLFSGRLWGFLLSPFTLSG